MSIYVGIGGWGSLRRALARQIGPADRIEPPNAASLGERRLTNTEAEITNVYCDTMVRGLTG